MPAKRAFRKVTLLHQVVTQNYRNLDALLENYLRVGTDLFGMKLGISSQVKGMDYVVVAVSPNDIGIKSGDIFPVQDTYCYEVIQTKRTVSIHNAGEVEPYKSHPCYENLRLESYISAPVYVSGEIFGTLSFSSVDRKPDPFDEFDIEMIEMMANSIGSFIEMKMAMEEAERHKQFAFLSGKLASLGEMAGGIAHEVNNPLTTIKLNCEMITELLAKGGSGSADEAKNRVEVAIRNINRIDEIIRDLISFSGEGSEILSESVNLWSVADYSCRTFRDLCEGAGIRLINEVSKDHFARGNGTGISQALLSLIRNAIDAVRSSADAWIKLESEATDSEVKIIVTDSGQGIAPEVQERMMDPFFSTKPLGLGTGLGLSVSSAVLERLQGKLTYDTSSKNTRFVVSLPRATPTG